MQPKYREIAVDLERRLKTHEWPAGTPLPGLPELQKHYQASLNVVRSAQAILIEAGLLRSVQGKGVFVLRLPPNDFIDVRTLAKQRIADAEVALQDARRVLEADDGTALLEGDQEINGPAHLRGVVRGQLVVQRGGYLRLSGSVERGLIIADGGYAEVERLGRVKNLLVEPGGRAILKGLALGVVENCRGGQLFIEGSVVGTLLGRAESGTEIHPGATIETLDQLSTRLHTTSRSQ